MTRTFRDNKPRHESDRKNNNFNYATRNHWFLLAAIMCLWNPDRKHKLWHSGKTYIYTCTFKPVLRCHLWANEKKWSFMRGDLLTEVQVIWKFPWKYQERVTFEYRWLLSKGVRMGRFWLYVFIFAAPSLPTGSTICYKCTASANPDQCTTITLCNKDQVCNDIS